MALDTCAYGFTNISKKPMQKKGREITMTKKLLVLLLAIALVCAIAVGCAKKDEDTGAEDGAKEETKKDEKKEETSDEAAGEDAFLTPPGEMPIVVAGTDITLTAFAQQQPRTDDYDMGENVYTDYVVEMTGIKLEFTTAPGADAKTKLNLLINSGDYPDIIWGQLTAPEMALYGGQGILTRLNELLDEQAVNYKAVVAEIPAAAEVTKALDGSIYAMPDINQCYHCAHNGRLWVYNPWFAENNWDVPSTTDAYYELLKKVKTSDANGNGKADEIPLATSSEGMTKLYYYFMNSFMIFTADRMWVTDDGKVRAGYMEEGYKEGMKYLNMLYEEELILQEGFTIKRDELRTIGENPDGVTIFSSPAHGPGDFVKKAGPSGRWWNYLTIPPLEGPDGIRNAMYRGSYNGLNPKYFITTNCKYPKTAVRLGDAFYDFEFYWRSYGGPLGETWEYAEEGTLGIHGEPALYREIGTYGAQDMNNSWDQMNHGFRSSYIRLSNEATSADRIYNYLESRDPSLAAEMQEYGSYNEVFKYAESKNNYHPYIYGDENIVPPLIYEDVKYAEMADVKAVLEPYVDEMFARFVSGDVSIEDDWDEYLEEMEAMGLSKMLDIMQEAYDAKFN